MPRGRLIAALALAIALMAVGLYLGEAAQLFMHAAGVCLACLGVG